MGVLPVSFGKLRQHYPARPNLTPELKRFMSQTPGTPCCVQVSHALNMAGERVPRVYAGQRRVNSTIRIGGADYYYLLAVDEMEKWLTLKYDPGEEVSRSGSGRRDPRAIKEHLQGRTGILTFRDQGYGFHTELWDGHQIVQRDMNENACFRQSRVLFWDCGPAQWLQDLMSS